MKPIAFLVFLYWLLAVEIAAGIDTLSFENCENLGAICRKEDIQGGNISLEQQKQNILSRLIAKSQLPYHDFVRLWNAGLKFYEAPESVEMKNHLTISNAWVLTPTAMPSVYEDGIYYVDEKGIVMTVYNYTLGLPENYYGKDKTCEEMPEVNEYDDCRTVYTGNDDISELNVYHDDQLIGKGILTKFKSNKTNTFGSVLDIKNKIYLDHYKYKNSNKCCRYSYCCWGSDESVECGRASRCGCEVYEKECKFDSKGTRIDALQLRSSFYAVKDKPLSMQEPDMIIDSSSMPVKATKKINTKNLRSYSINTKSQSLKKNFAKYKVEYLYPPQNILYAYAEKGDNWYVYNAKLVDTKSGGDLETITFLTDRNNLEQCMIKAETHFNSSEIRCTLIFLEERELSLMTDKWVYKTNDTIKLSINIEGGLADREIIKIFYANQSKELKLASSTIETTLAPELGKSLIIAEIPSTDKHGSAIVSAYITVYEQYNYSPFIFAVLTIAIIYIAIRYTIKNES